MITKTYQIKAPVSKVWQALVDPDVIKQWSGAPAVMSAQEDADFKLWDGDMWGKNIKVNQEKLLIQDWYAEDWTQPSIVEFHLSNKGNSTELKLVHTNVPKESEESYANGWDDFYCGAIKDLLED